MKIGKTVAVLHDNKWGRRVKGEVIATRRGHHIKVRFIEPITETTVEFWARINRVIRYERKAAGSCITYLGRYKYFSGWAEVDTWMPWYSVRPWKDYSKEELDYHKQCAEEEGK